MDPGLKECHWEDCYLCNSHRAIYVEDCGERHPPPYGQRLYTDIVAGCETKDCTRHRKPLWGCHFRDAQQAYRLQSHTGELQSQARRSASPPASIIQPYRTRTPPVNTSYGPSHSATSFNGTSGSTPASTYPTPAQYAPPGATQVQALSRDAPAQNPYKPFVDTPAFMSCGPQSSNQAISSGPLHNPGIQQNNSTQPGSRTPAVSGPSFAILRPYNHTERRFTDEEDAMILTHTLNLATCTRSVENDYVRLASGVRFA